MPRPQEAQTSCVLSGSCLEMDCHFRMRVNAVGGLQAFGAARLLEIAGVISWEQLGGMGEARWQEVVAVLPAKRMEEASDLRDMRRLGPGHLNSLDELRKLAVKDHRALAAARGQAPSATVATAGSSTVGGQASPATDVEPSIASLASLAWPRARSPGSGWPAASEAAWPRARGAGPYWYAFDASRALVEAYAKEPPTGSRPRSWMD